MSVPATDKQMKYLRKLVDVAGGDMHQHLIDRGISELQGWPTAVKVARKPTKTEASQLISELAPASTGGRNRHSTYRSSRSSGYVRCSHIDYPCCGCGS